MAEVGSGQIAIIPTFQGFRSRVTSEAGGAGRAGGQTFNSAFNAGAGDPGAALIKQLNAKIAAGSSALSKARLAEQDAAGKVRVAETALAEARTRGGATSARTIAAEERLAAAQRRLTTAQDRTRTASDGLAQSQARLADATAEAGESGETASGRYARGWAGLRQRLSGVVRRGVADAGDAAEPVAEQSGRRAGDGFSGAFKKALGVLAAAFAAQNIVGGFKSAVEEASGLGESVNALNVVYGEASEGVQQLGKESAKSLGLSNLEFNNLAVRFSSFAQTISGPGGDVAGTLKDLTGRASDFASVMNLEVSDATQLFQSGLAGEAEPLRAYGIDLSAAAVEAYALEKGISKSAASMSESEKIQARYGLLMEKTSQTSGDFANTSDQLANQQRIFAASFANTKATLGSLFLPALAGVFGFMNSVAVPAADRLLASLSGGNGVFKEVAGGFVAMFAAFKAGDGDVTSSGFAGFMERVGNAAREVTGGITAMFAAFKAGDGDITSSGFAGFMEQVGGAARELFNSVVALAPQFMALFAALSPTSLIFQVLLPVLPQIAAAIGSVLSAVLPLAVSLTSQLIPVITQLISAVLPMMIAIFSDVITAIAPLITQIADLLIPIIEALLPVVVTVFTVVAAVVTSAMQIVQGIIQVVTGIITGNWRQVWDGIVNIVTGALRTVGNVLTGLKDIVVSALSGAGAWLVDSGKSLIQGFIDGISGMVGAIGDAVGGVLGAVADFFPHSPAKKGPFSGRGYTTYSGAALAGDFADSISAQRSKVEAAALAVTSAATLSGSFATTGAGSGSAAAAGYNLPAFNVYIGNEQLDSRMFRVADTAIASADSSSQFSRRGR